MNSFIFDILFIYCQAHIQYLIFKYLMLLLPDTHGFYCCCHTGKEWPHTRTHIHAKVHTQKKLGKKAGWEKRQKGLEKKKRKGKKRGRKMEKGEKRERHRKKDQRKKGGGRWVWGDGGGWVFRRVGPLTNNVRTAWIFSFFITCKRSKNANNATHFVKLGKKRRAWESSKRKCYINPQRLIKAIFIIFLGLFNFLDSHVYLMLSMHILIFNLYIQVCQFNYLCRCITIQGSNA